MNGYATSNTVDLTELWPSVCGLTFFGPPCTSDMNDRPRVCWCLTLSPWASSHGDLCASVMGLLQLRYEHDSSTIRLRFGYNTLQHATRFSCARIRDRIRESVVGVSCMLIDSSMHTAFTVYLYRPTLSCVWICQKLSIQRQLNANMPSIQLITVKL